MSKMTISKVQRLRVICRTTKRWKPVGPIPDEKLFSRSRKYISQHRVISTIRLAEFSHDWNKRFQPQTNRILTKGKYQRLVKTTRHVHDAIHLHEIDFWHFQMTNDSSEQKLKKKTTHIGIRPISLPSIIVHWTPVIWHWSTRTLLKLLLFRLFYAFIVCISHVYSNPTRTRRDV